MSVSAWSPIFLVPYYMQKLQHFFLRNHISAAAWMRTFLTSLRSSLKIGLALKGSDEISQTCPPCAQRERGGGAWVRPEKRLDVVWHIEMIVCLGGHGKHTVLDLESWNVKLQKDPEILLSSSLLYRWEHSKLGSSFKVSLDLGLLNSRSVFWSLQNIGLGLPWDWDWVQSVCYSLSGSAWSF